MVHKNTGGFTLIELIFAMTISSGLAVIALMGFSAMRSQAQFSSAVEKALGDVVAVRTEANSTVNIAGTGTDLSHVIFGKLLTFSSGSSVVDVQNLVTTTSPVGGSHVSAVSTGEQFTFDWGVKYSDVTTKIAFIRSPSDGMLYTVKNPVGTTFAGYQIPIAAAAGNATLLVTDPGGTRSANIIIDLTNSAVTRKYP